MESSNTYQLRVVGNDFEVLDPANDLRDCVVFVAFPKSRSENFPLARRLASGGKAYGEQEIDGRVLYWAGFTTDEGQLSTAAELLRLTSNWVGCIAKIGGRRVFYNMTAYFTLTCYLKSLRCMSQPAHCHVVIDDPFHPDYDQFSHRVRATGNSKEHVRRYIFPCKLALAPSSVTGTFRFDTSVYISPQLQIQAFAVENGFEFCPAFDAAAFRELNPSESKSISRDTSNPWMF